VTELVARFCSAAAEGSGDWQILSAQTVTSRSGTALGAVGLLLKSTTGRTSRVRSGVLASGDGESSTQAHEVSSWSAFVARAMRRLILRGNPRTWSPTDSRISTVEKRKTSRRSTCTHASSDVYVLVYPHRLSAPENAVTPIGLRASWWIAAIGTVVVRTRSNDMVRHAQPMRELEGAGPSWARRSRRLLRRTHMVHSAEMTPKRIAGPSQRGILSSLCLGVYVSMCRGAW
jgi:hypothetical protein